MPAPAPVPAGADSVLGFTLPRLGVRGRVVQLGAVVDAILRTHQPAAPVARLLGEALALTAMLGSLLRPDDGELTLQARGDGGPVALLVADFRDHQLRGYAGLDPAQPLPAAPASLESLFGSGYLALTLDQPATAERYQGIVELGQTDLQAAAQNYFANSEQLPSLVRLAAAPVADGSWRAGGLILQQLQRQEQDAERLHLAADAEADANWQHAATLAASITDGELVDASLSHAERLWRLFHGDEVRVLPAEPLSRGCRCSVAHIRQVLAQFPEAERAEMRDAEGRIRVDCEFCATQFVLDL